MIINIQGVPFELPYDLHPNFNEDEIMSEEINGKTLVGYITEDEDAEHPFDSDGGTRIVTTEANSIDGDFEAYQEARGFNSDWCPDLDLVEGTEELKAVWMKETKEMFDFRTAAADYFEYYDADDIPDNALTEFAKLVYNEEINGVFCTDFDFYDNIRFTAWVQLKNEGKIGDPYAVLLDCYDHSGRVWSVSGEGAQCQYDTSSGVGLWIPGKYEREQIDIEVSNDSSLTIKLAAERRARDDLNAYNNYINGIAYGVMVTLFDEEGEELDEYRDAVWGYLTEEYAREDLRTAFLSAKVHLKDLGVGNG